MTEIALEQPIEPSPLPRLLHGGAALLTTLGALFLVALIVGAVIGGKFAVRAALAARTQSIATLETALKTQQAELGSNLQRIGANDDDWRAVLSSPNIIEVLGADADAMAGAVEALGFKTQKPHRTCGTPPHASAFHIHDQSQLHGRQASGSNVAGRRNPLQCRHRQSSPSKCRC